LGGSTPVPVEVEVDVDVDVEVEVDVEVDVALEVEVDVDVAEEVDVADEVDVAERPLSPFDESLPPPPPPHPITSAATSVAISPAATLRRPLFIFLEPSTISLQIPFSTAIDPARPKLQEYLSPACHSEDARDPEPVRL